MYLLLLARLSCFMLSLFSGWQCTLTVHTVSAHWQCALTFNGGTYIHISTRTLLYLSLSYLCIILANLYFCYVQIVKNSYVFTPTDTTLNTDLPSSSIHVKTTRFGVNGVKMTQHSPYSPSQSIINYVPLSSTTSYSNALEGIRKSVHCYIIISINPLITSALCTNVNVSAICLT
jgi:hypothetical protein